MSGDEYREKSPRNALPSPAPGPAGSGADKPGNGRLVVARLVWEESVEVVPATLLLISKDQIFVEWRQGEGPSRVWLPKADVRASLRWDT